MVVPPSRRSVRRRRRRRCARERVRFFELDEVAGAPARPRASRSAAPPRTAAPRRRERPRPRRRRGPASASSPRASSGRQAAAEHVRLPGEPRRHLAAEVPERLEVAARRRRRRPAGTPSSSRKPAFTYSSKSTIIWSTISPSRGWRPGAPMSTRRREARLVHRRHLGGDEAAEAEPDERRAPSPSFGERLQEQDREVARLARPLRPLRLAVAGQVGHVHGGPLGELLVERDPPGIPRRVVQDDHRRRPPRPSDSGGQGPPPRSCARCGSRSPSSRALLSRQRLPGPGASLLYMRAPSRAGNQENIGPRIVTGSR